MPKKKKKEEKKEEIKEEKKEQIKVPDSPILTSQFCVMIPKTV
jgi:hypothetical protein